MRCHSAGGPAEDLPWDNYGNIFSHRGAILNQVYACRMPPPVEPQPNPDERAKLLAWLVCGAQNN